MSKFFDVILSLDNRTHDEVINAKTKKNWVTEFFVPFEKQPLVSLKNVDE